MAQTLATVTDDIDKEAGNWDGHKMTLNRTNHAVQDLRLNYLEAGPLFLPIVSKHDAVCTMLTENLLKGQNEAATVSSCLRRCSKAYRNNEADMSEVVANTFHG
jgi:hypothetical protein